MPDKPEVPEVPDKPDKNERIRLPGNVSTPEQGCLGCSAAITMIVLSLAFWLYIWWLKEPNMHLKAPAIPPGAITPSGATATPPAQQTLHYNKPIPQN